MSSCEQELLALKLKELYCKKGCKPECEVNNFICNGRDGGNDGCEVEICGCCDDKKKSCDYCDCCVDPMKFLLNQFTPGDQIVVATDDGSIYGEYWGNAYFVCVNDSVLTVRVDYYGNAIIEKISICHIVFVYSDDIQTAKLLDNKCEPNKGYCKCCEKPIRNLLEAYCGLVVYIYPGYSWYTWGTVTRVSDGIAILNDTIAISTCKVNNVELYQGGYLPLLKDNEKPYMKVEELMKKREERAKKAKEQPKEQPKEEVEKK